MHRAAEAHVRGDRLEKRRLLRELFGKPPMAYLETAAEGQVTDSPFCGSLCRSSFR